MLVITVLVYWPGLSGPWLLDDYGNLQALGQNGGIHSSSAVLEFVFGNASGPSGRPVAMLSFLIDGQDWPLDPRAFKFTNLMIHLLCGLMLCWVVFLLSRMMELSHSVAGRLALAVSALWLIHPLNVSTTLYVVQRMTQLMTLFSLASLLCYLSARSVLQRNPARSSLLLGLALFPFGLLAVFSKENGALLLLLIVVMETTLFRTLPRTMIFKFWYGAGVLFPLALIVGYLLMSAPDSMVLYESRHFGLLERLLSECRILLIYLVEIFLPALGQGALFHDDFEISSGLLNPVSTLGSIVLLLVLLISAIRVRRTHPVYAFSVLWFFTMHLLESSYLPLELYFEHRNYMAMIGPLFGMLWYLQQYLLITKPRFSNRISMLAYLVFFGAFAGTSYAATGIWGDREKSSIRWAQKQPESLRAQMYYAEYLIDSGSPEIALQRLQQVSQYYPNEITLQLFMWNLSCTYQLAPPLSLAQITNNDALEYYRDNINYHLELLIENKVAGLCEYPSPDELIALFERMGELPMRDITRSFYYFYFADIFVHYGLLSPALINLSRSNELVPKTGIPLRQAELAFSAGNYLDALVFLERASLQDDMRPWMAASLMAEISSLELEVTARLNSTE